MVLELVRPSSQSAFTDMETDILHVLRSRVAQIITFDQFERALARPPASRRALAVHICAIRRKVEEHPHWPRHVLTVRGRGYVFRN
jgi:DNA-binding response OmpR family regulator